MMQKNILNEIADKTRIRINAEKEDKSLEQLKEAVLKMLSQKEGTLEDGHGRFYQALGKRGMSFICEVKKASPSKGLIAEDFPYQQIAKDYEAAGAAAISCLTEPDYFKGSNKYLNDISQIVDLPVLKKDFTIDPYMIYQAAYYGASAVLLICAILSDDELCDFRELAESLGLDALVEAHDEDEVMRAINSGARIIGVNNRDLRTFEVDLNNSIRLRGLVPPEILFVSESGIKNADDIKALYDNGVDAVLIGETLMRSADKGQMLRDLQKGIHI